MTCTKAPVVPTSGAKANGRVELEPPSHSWISWCILLAYLAVFAEGVALFCRSDYSDDFFTRMGYAQFHLCTIYVLEVAMALGPGWCAMSPGWTCGELMAHHVPYTIAIILCFGLGQQIKWALVLQVVLLTPLNEGLFIVNSLGAPGWVSKVRRVFGFGVIVALMIAEIIAWGRSLRIRLSIGTQHEMTLVFVELIVLPAVYYHFNLICMYVKRWRKTRSL